MATSSPAGLAAPSGERHHAHAPEDLRKEPLYPVWQRVRAGDRASRDQVVQQYAPLVKYVVGRMAIALPASMDRDDILSAGTVGLLQAVDRFDPDQGVRFQTYALRRIRGAITDAIRTLSPLSRTTIRRAREVEAVFARLSQVLGRFPSTQEVSAELGLPPVDVEVAIQEASYVVHSLNGWRVAQDEDSLSYGDIVPDEQQLDAAEAAEEQELLSSLTDAVKTLPIRDQLVLNLYYRDGLTLREISQVLEVSESRVSQIHTAAVIKLRTALRRVRAAATSA